MCENFNVNRRMFCVRKRSLFSNLKRIILCFIWIFVVSWILFIKYIYHSNGMIKIPSAWGITSSCVIHKNMIRDWSYHLNMFINERKEIIQYNISSKYCSDKFYPDFESNLEKVISTKIVQNAPCIDVYSYNSKNRTNHRRNKNRQGDFPVIVTAASSNHFYESQAFFKSIHKHLYPLYGPVKVIFYDIGLTREENESMRKYCQCEVRRFPFEEFSPHVSLLGGYAWKPLLILDVLREYDFVMFLDACMRFKEFMFKSKFDEIISNARTVGIQLQQSPRWIVSNHTKLDTFDFLEENECLFDYPELESGWILIHKNSFTMNAIIRPWVACALTEHCMTHPYPLYLKPCSKDLWKLLLWTRCHRFDQSVLNIILIRIFNRYRKLIEFDGSRIMDILRDDKAQYFPSLNGQI